MCPSAHVLSFCKISNASREWPSREAATREADVMRRLTALGVSAHFAGPYSAIPSLLGNYQRHAEITGSTPSAVGILFPKGYVPATGSIGFRLRGEFRPPH
jgi:hypothetical protein